MLHSSMTHDFLLFLRREVVCNFKNADRMLYPGIVSQEHFEALMLISKIRGGEISQALHDFLVNGVSREDVFNIYNVKPSYFSKKLKQIRECNRIVFSMRTYY
ncbi:transcriptional regulator [Salmonella enterica subsp. diarizonae]|nr:transcriptional regulator [Salmonella enterica subsp. diarizonae]